MLSTLDHFVLLTRNFSDAIQDYQILLGFEPDELTIRYGFQIASFRTGNTALEIMAPQNEAALSKTDEILGEAQSKLTSLAFSTPDLAEAQRVLTHRGGEPTEISTSFRLSDKICAGVKTFIVAEDTST